MAVKCKSCAHDARKEIDLALLAGEGRREVAARYGLSEGAVTRHARYHVRAPQPAARDGDERQQAAVSSLEEVRARKAAIDAVIKRARERGSDRDELNGMKEWRAMDDHERRLLQSQEDAQWLWKTPVFQEFVSDVLKVVQRCPAHHCGKKLEEHGKRLLGELPTEPPVQDGDES